MKKYYLLSFALLSATVLFAQSHSQGLVKGYDPGNSECLSDLQRKEIQGHIKNNIDSLRSIGRLPQHYSTQQVLFDWPMRLRSGLNDYGYHSISAQVDHDPAFPNMVQDYNCGTRTYDNTSGYNHAGTDFFLWPFAWNKMDSGDVEIVAVAPGTIIYKSDGNFDRSCGFNSNNWNAVYVQHADGSVAWYGHMKKNSLTTKTVNQTVVTGEYLGSVGSSGNSTGPHLHLEIYDSSNVLQDPFQGSCNNFNNFSWWNNQRPYIDAGINHITTNFTPPAFAPCPNEDIKNEQNYFTNTDTIFLMTYYRFLSLNDSVLITIYRPNSTVWSSWWWVNNWSNYNAAFVYWWAILGSAEPSGQWEFEAVYKNQSYLHDFYIGGTGINENEHAHFALYPNPNDGNFTLSMNDPSLDLSSGKVSLTISDVLGKEVLNRNINSARTDISKSDLSKGIYFYTVNDAGKKLAVGKFVVN